MNKKYLKFDPFIGLFYIRVITIYYSVLFIFFFEVYIRAKSEYVIFFLLSKCVCIYMYINIMRAFIYSLVCLYNVCIFCSFTLFHMSQ